ncbi:MAG: GNAT family N-acetyltransferase [Oscillospiraceae bacterium]|nr:GNAT family N-acetyltransferase [Oscillospiraceae bacterium]
MESIDIRRAKNGDEKILAYIQTESWKSAFRGILSDEDLEKLTDITRVTEMYERTLRNYPEHGFILLIGEKPHCISFWSASRENDMKDFAELICIHSLPDNRRRGYGSMMIEHIFGEIKKAGFEKVMLWVFADNLPARKFYEKAGFVPNGKTKLFRGAVEMMYCKDL